MLKIKRGQNIKITRLLDPRRLPSHPHQGSCGRIVAVLTKDRYQIEINRPKDPEIFLRPIVVVSFKELEFFP